MITNIDIIVLNLCVIVLIVEEVRLRKKFKDVNKLVSAETRRKIAHTQAFKNLTDEDKIQAEMERGADIIEARQGSRLLMPRPNAGPPARVFRPKYAGKRGNFWNPPAN